MLVTPGTGRVFIERLNKKLKNMYNPSLKEFIKFSKLGNVIPVYKEINADLDTPVSAFLKIRKGKIEAI